VVVDRRVRAAEVARNVGMATLHPRVLVPLLIIGGH
jgi:hypothetical protein